jgi:N-acetylmuramoyl-L-alanine amidase
MVITTNGKTTQMDSAPLIENGRTYLPARYIAEALGYTVQWNAAGQTVNIVGMQ